MNLLSICIGICAGHFTYQVFGPQDWLTATERSFFTCATVAIVSFVMWTTREKP